MLKRKLEKKKAAALDLKKSKTTQPDAITSGLFVQPFWMQFYKIECQLNEQLATLGLPTGITCTYNPVEYASSLHCAYLSRYLCGPKRVIFIGMNPGPNGMGQTGVPFGNVRTVRDMMHLSGEVLQPSLLHRKRPVNGLNCKIEEPSGVRLWELFERLAAGSLDTLSQQCFVHNFCPLAFFDEEGNNITPSELKGQLKQQIRDVCLDALEKQLQLLQPQFVVAVGEYVHKVLNRSKYCQTVSVSRLPHPSPRSLHNTNWSEKAQAFLEEQDLIKFMRNEAQGISY
ncbi:single-strand selective monofunctional uracil DNA glycosylase [Drosophila novamexicana]|uniref:single-strand selective monofunctional uracil DNA glycosylase n=1 Tax=Drosophila novamexicana TaxID=47314 RepID=UPI0011E5CA1F|nr:single-strand selective monofunctional uracil DNA glycosylase [Drosophila novamexicana]